MLTKISVTGQLACWELAIHDCWWCLIIFYTPLICVDPSTVSCLLFQGCPNREAEASSCCQLLHINTSREHSPQQIHSLHKGSKFSKLQTSLHLTSPLSPWNALTFQTWNRGSQMSIQYILQLEAEQGCKFLLKSPVKSQWSLVPTSGDSELDTTIKIYSILKGATVLINLVPGLFKFVCLGFLTPNFFPDCCKIQK